MTSINYKDVFQFQYLGRLLLHQVLQTGENLVKVLQKQVFAAHQEIIVLDLTINYKIPAHFKNDCLLNNSINIIARKPIIANLPLVISE